MARRLLRTDVKADLLGEGNEAVLRECLNLSDVEIAQLYKRQGACPGPDLDSEPD